MKKVIENLFGVKVFADVKNINGRKSNGAEDYGYEHWRKDYNQPTSESIN